MPGKILFVAGLLTVGILAGPQSSSATPPAPVVNAMSAEADLVQQVHWRHRHSRHCRRVCHGHMHWSHWRGWHCHGHWHYRCHWHHHHW